MRGAALLLALTTAAVSGCSAFATNRGPDPATQLHDGLVAVSSGDYRAGRSLLEPLFYERWSETVGQRAALALIAAELDSRNPSRQLWTAADLSARLLNVPDLQPWMVPLAESYYLLAVELGAVEERLARADSALKRAEHAAAVSSGRTLPQPSARTVPARINEIAGERDQLRRRLTGVQEELAARDLELKETKAELERIKRTIKP